MKKMSDPGNRGNAPFLPARLLAVLLLAPGALLAGKTDVVIFKNGDHLTGEVKKMERGKLHFKTDATGTIAIEWDEVAHLKSDARFQVEIRGGTLYFGSIESTDEKEVTKVAGTDFTQVLENPEVVRMTKIKESFWGRVDGSLSLGYSYTQSSDVTQFSLGFDWRYRSRKRSFGTDFSAIVTDQIAGTTKRFDLAIPYTRFYRKRRFAMGALSFQSNQELGIDLRTTVAGGPGLYLVKSNSNRLELSGGLGLNREEVTDSDEVNESVEGFLRLAYEFFRYDFPESNISADLVILPSLTERDRVRIDFDASVRQEIVDDFFWDFTFFENYDSRPPNPDAADNDYGIVTSLGWSF